MAWHDSNIVPCEWQKTDEGWRLWVKGHPGIFGTGLDYPQAEESLVDAIWEHAPDLDAIIPTVPEFDPPLPIFDDEAPYRDPVLFKLSGDGLFEIDKKVPGRREQWESLFVGGTCGECGAPRGPRSDETTVVDHATLCDAGFVRGIRGHTMRIFSDRFLNLLTAAERQRFEFRPIKVLDGGGPRQYFELVGRPDVGYVCPTSADAVGWRCSQCSADYWGAEILGLDLRDFVCREDLPSDQSALFLAGREQDPYFVASRPRWDAIRGREGTTGLNSNGLGVVPAAGCDRNPRLRIGPGPCEICAEWPTPRHIQDKRQCIFQLSEGGWSMRNWRWLTQALAEGDIQITRQSRPLDEFCELLMSGPSPSKPPTFLSFRCPKCWNLGRMVLTDKELMFRW